MINNLVHGDLREQNILCQEDKIMLIDFDWGSIVGEAHYPYVLLCPELRNGQSGTSWIISEDDDRRILGNMLRGLKKIVANS